MIGIYIFVCLWDIEFGLANIIDAVPKGCIALVYMSSSYCEHPLCIVLIIGKQNTALRWSTQSIDDRSRVAFKKLNYIEREYFNIVYANPLEETKIKYH